MISAQLGETILPYGTYNDTNKPPYYMQSNMQPLSRCVLSGDWLSEEQGNTGLLISGK